jgi:hypothetical protein
MGYVIVGVLMVVGIIVLIPFFFSLGETAESGAMQMACRKSLDIAEGLKIVENNLVDFSGTEVELECPTEYLSTDSTGEQLTKEFAEHMHDCWKTWGGRENLFDKSRGTYCVICKSIDVVAADRFTEGLVDYIVNQEPIQGKGTYISKYGTGRLIDEGANEAYNFYQFGEGETAIVVTFGTIGFSGQHLIMNDASEIGILLHPRGRVGGLGCYSFEGRSTSLEFIR